MKRVTALFNQETHRRLKIYAMDNHMTLIEIINDAVIAYLKESDKSNSTELHDV